MFIALFEYHVCYYDAVLYLSESTFYIIIFMCLFYHLYYYSGYWDIMQLE